MAASKKKSFMIYIDYRQHLDLLTDEERGKLITALFDYAESRKIPDLPGAAMMAFSFIKAQMDRDERKYIERCEVNKANGAKGGRPPEPKETENNRKEPTETENNPKEPKETERLFEKPKKPDTDTDTDTDKDTDKDKDKDTETKETTKGDKPPAAEAATKEPVPFKKIQELFLETCPSYPAIRAVNGQRKKAVAARWNEHKDIEVFKAVFEKAEASSFLKGRNERNWAATFDWMMKPTNFLKILEDNYQEKSSKDKEPADSSDRKAPALTGFKMATSSDEIETGPYNGHDEEESETTQGHKLTGFKMATDPEDED
jgi:hypothetical protein